MKIIAEVGSNWTTQDDVMTSIHMAKAMGADAVKFQLFSDIDLYGLPSPSLSKYSLPKHWMPEMKRLCDKHDIEFMCTAFSVESLLYVNSFVDTHKLASSDLTHIRMHQTLRNIAMIILLPFIRQ